MRLQDIPDITSIMDGRDGKFGSVFKEPHVCVITLTCKQTVICSRCPQCAASASHLGGVLSSASTCRPQMASDFRKGNFLCCLCCMYSESSDVQGKKKKCVSLTAALSGACVCALLAAFLCCFQTFCLCICTHLFYSLSLTHFLCLTLESRLFYNHDAAAEANGNGCHSSADCSNCCLSVFCVCTSRRILFFFWFIFCLCIWRIDLYLSKVLSWASK